MTRSLVSRLTSWLGQEGFQVRACHDGLSLVKHWPVCAPAAVVLDDAARRQRPGAAWATWCNDSPEPPVLMLSARGEPLDRILGLQPRRRLPGQAL